MVIIIKKEKTNWKYIIIIVILALIVAGESFLLLTQEGKIPEIKLPQKITQGEIAGWKTYQSGKNGFEIKYPTDLQIESYEFTGICPGCADLYKFEPGNIKITIGKSISWEVAKTNLEQEIDGKSENITIAGLNGIKREGKATKFSSFTQEGVEIKEIILKGSNDNIFHFFTTKQEETTFDQIISTFRFLE